MNDNEQEADGISSFWFGIFTILLALVASWISLHGLAAIVMQGLVPIFSGASFNISDLNNQSMFIFLGITFGSLAIAIFLFSLSYRLMTGKGRKSDNGLMNPPLLIIFSILTFILGMFGFYFAYTSEELRPAIGGIVFTIVGVKGISLGLERIRNKKKVLN